MTVEMDLLKIEKILCNAYASSNLQRVRAEKSEARKPGVSGKFFLLDIYVRSARTSYVDSTR